ncbi:histone-arginine methyltransferase CARM1-like isoform X1 [Harpia harpyja]|uniref:histone-arginine methyltransferase CARM1-like isoform X1 n=2 Tax=Harpia harpyja TaxID=202280 RepID=UPI0022B0B5ED|nr:histone-arginine methyltransferase CARM1-like isoform X1 [Harpia harpyja]
MPQEAPEPWKWSVGEASWVGLPPRPPPSRGLAGGRRERLFGRQPLLVEGSGGDHGRSVSASSAAAAVQREAAPRQGGAAGRAAARQPQPGSPAAGGAARSGGRGRDRDRRDTEYCRVGKQSVLIMLGYNSALLQFKSQAEYNTFSNAVKRCRSQKKNSVFSQRTDEASAAQYFQFYGCLSQQQNMMQDFVRTATYHRAIVQNYTDFTDKVVLDVGCGSGILSFFAVQAGARRVYAVEASSMAKYAELLVRSNNLSDKITILAGKIEEISLPENVDVVISEPMGYMLFNERMLESYLHSKKWLKSNGMMFPTYSDIHLAPFSDEQLYMEHYSRANFWYQEWFYGVNLSSLRSAAVDEYLQQPIVDTFDVRILMAQTVKYTINFMEATEEDLHRVEIPFVFQMMQSGLIHGLAFWFDVAFVGSLVTVWLSTAPTEPLTHWYQVRCLLQTPLFAKEGETLSGKVLLVANKRQSYDIQIVAMVDQTGFKSGNIIDLKNPFFRFV